MTFCLCENKESFEFGDGKSKKTKKKLYYIKIFFTTKIWKKINLLGIDEGRNIKKLKINEIGNSENKGIYKMFKFFLIMLIF